MTWWIDRLAQVEVRFEELNRLLSDPETLSSPDKVRKLAKEHAGLAPVVESYRRYRSLQEQLAGVEEMVREEKDPSLQAMAREEKEGLEKGLARTEEVLKGQLIPRDPNDDRNILLEIRAGTGGEEAALFAADLARMYARFAEKKGWKAEVMSSSPTELGGFKEIVFLVKGDGAYSALKFEGGVHRVQRVPETESGGRIHTSVVSVAVMPEAEDVEVDIRPDEIRLDIYRSSGCGGQGVNTTDSAVRLTHLPTGLVVTCQDERSQLKNKSKAMKILKSRLLKKMQEEQRAHEDGLRRSMVGSGDRSDKIRTYNFPQNRVTDHRINLTLHRLSAVLDGDLDEIAQGLQASHQAEQLKTMEIA